MKRVANKDDVDNVGEFAWGEENGIKYITLALPAPTAKAPDNYIMNYLPVTLSPKVAKHWEWNGNEDVPTLNPSIHCIGHWHGWVRDGQMVEA